MEAVIISVESFPLFVRERIHTSKVSVKEQDGRIILAPMEDDTHTGLIQHDEFWDKLGVSADLLNVEAYEIG